MLPNQFLRFCFPGFQNTVQNLINLISALLGLSGEGDQADVLGKLQIIADGGQVLLDLALLELVHLVGHHHEGAAAIYEPAGHGDVIVGIPLFYEFFQALCTNAGLNMHIRMICTGEVHHLFEAIFKGFAKALDQATSVDPRVQGVLSTKGSL